MEKMTELFYDKEGDVLYLTVGGPRKAISREIGDDVLLRLDPDTGEIVGITVLNLSARFGSLESPQTIPVGVELHQIGEG